MSYAPLHLKCCSTTSGPFYECLSGHMGLVWLAQLILLFHRWSAWMGGIVAKFGM